MIENIQYKFESNRELVMLSSAFLEKYVYTQNNDHYHIDDETINSGNVQIKDINNNSNNQ